MKFLFFTMLVTLSAFADDAKLCDYLKTYKFESYSESALPWAARKSLVELTKEVSVEVDKDRARACKTGVLDFKNQRANCEHQCALHGSSQYRYFANGVSSGMLPLNTKTQRCQDLCRGYWLLAKGFQDGMKGQANDCSVGVTRGDRGNTKSDLKSVIREIAKEKSTKQ